MDDDGAGTVVEEPVVQPGTEGAPEPGAEPQPKPQGGSDNPGVERIKAENADLRAQLAEARAAGRARLEAERNTPEVRKARLDRFGEDPLTVLDELEQKVTRRAMRERDVDRSDGILERAEKASNDPEFRKRLKIIHDDLERRFGWEDDEDYQRVSMVHRAEMILDHYNFQFGAKNGATGRVIPKAPAGGGTGGTGGGRPGEPSAAEIAKATKEGNVALLQKWEKAGYL